MSIKAANPNGIKNWSLGKNLILSLAWFFIFVFLGLAPLLTPWSLPVLYQLDTSLASSPDKTYLAQQTLDFLLSPSSNQESINTLQSLTLNARPLYSRAEITHLIDVRNLFRLLVLFAFISGLGLLIHLRSMTVRQRYIHIRWVFVRLTGLGLGLAGLMLFWWDAFFVSFHRLLFPMGNWTFEANSGLITLFPERFWIRIAEAWLVMTLGWLLLFFSVFRVGLTFANHSSSKS